jgi:hypothetical protein
VDGTSKRRAVKTGWCRDRWARRRARRNRPMLPHPPCHRRHGTVGRATCNRRQGVRPSGFHGTVRPASGAGNRAESPASAAEACPQRSAAHRGLDRRGMSERATAAGGRRIGRRVILPCALCYGELPPHAERIWRHEERA